MTHDVKPEQPLAYLANELRETRDSLLLALKITEDIPDLNYQIWDSMTPALKDAVNLEIKLAWARERDAKRVANRDQ